MTETAATEVGKKRKDRFKKKEWAACETALSLVIDGTLGQDELDEGELATFKAAREKVRLRMAADEDEG